MKVYVNRLPVSGPWGGGNMWVSAVYEHLEGFGHEIVPANNSVIAPDVVLLAGLDNDMNGISAEQAIMYKSVMEGQRDVRIILRVNENDARKGTSGVDDLLLQVSKHIDGTVFVSQWLQEYFVKKGWGCPNHTVIKNGVDQEIFKPGTKHNDGKVHLVTHHWSNNEMKGFDIYEKLDEWIATNPGFDFTYIGRERGTFKNTKVIRPLHGKRLGEELSKYDVYVSASRFDPGPNHVLESIACGIPTYVCADGGGCVEFAGPEYVYSSWEELTSILREGIFHRNTEPVGDWKSCIEEYVKFMEATCLRGI